MFLIPQCLTVQSTASKVSRNSSTPAHNTGHAVATLTKTQQLVCSRGRAGVGMQTVIKRILLRGTMLKPLLVRACCAGTLRERAASTILVQRLDVAHALMCCRQRKSGSNSYRMVFVIPHAATHSHPVAGSHGGTSKMLWCHW